MNVPDLKVTLGRVNGKETKHASELSQVQRHELGLMKIVTVDMPCIALRTVMHR